MLPDVQCPLCSEGGGSQPIYCSTTRSHGCRADSVLERVPGLTEFIAWIDERGLKKAAVTNAPRENARVMLAALGLGCAFPPCRVTCGQYVATKGVPLVIYHAGLKSALVWRAYWPHVCNCSRIFLTA